MTDPIFDPNQAGQVSTSQQESADTHQDIFGGSNDVFNNPDMFHAIPSDGNTPTVETPADDFVLDFDQLQANNAPVSSEPEIIEPATAHDEHAEMTQDYSAQPEIIEQVVEPQMKPEVKVNPWKQTVAKTAPTVTPKPSIQAPTPKPPHTVPVAKPAPVKVQAKPVQVVKSQPIQEVVPPVIEPQMKPEVKINPRKQAPAKTAPANTPKPSVQTPMPRPPQAVPEAKPAPVKSQAPVVQKEVAPQIASSDLQKKLTELIDSAHAIYTLEKKDTDQALEILGANNDKVTILYQITLPEHGITIKKIETDRETGEEVINDLAFMLDTDTTSVQIILDDVLLFDEVEHLQDDAKKKMQVSEKLNKFIFLLSEHQKKLEKEIKEKEEAEQERRRLQDIFRNF